MICAPAGTLTLILDWLDKTLTQISRADGLATLRSRRMTGWRNDEPDTIRQHLEAEVARLRSLFEARKSPLEMI
ncbi:hypothetical protein ACFFWD_31865 [Bradyrhizobium erythrophlei]|uniref:hypothetical protein n=1 Tax=Bradyrhizobium erythrophlei TaxID=1437360 RepID=UPI0035ED6A55